MPLLLVFSALLFVSACGEMQRGKAQFSGYSTTCIDGVAYVQLASGASVKYTPDGSVAKCK